MIHKETLEIFKGEGNNNTFEYEVSSKVNQGYKLLYQDADYARLIRVRKSSISREELEKIQELKGMK